MSGHTWEWQLVAGRTETDSDGTWEVHASVAAGPVDAHGERSWYIRADYPDARPDPVTVRTGPLPTFEAAVAQARVMISSRPDMAALGRAIAGDSPARPSISGPVAGHIAGLLDQIARFLHPAGPAG